MSWDGLPTMLDDASLAGRSYIAGPHHVGLSVSNLDRSIVFYRDSLGMQLVSGRIFSGDAYERILGLPGATGRLAVLRSGSVRVELFEFLNPAPASMHPRRSVADHGITHFALQVTDIAALYERLVDEGVHFHCPPIDFVGIARATYGRDPDGNVFELVQLMPSV